MSRPVILLYVRFPRALPWAIMFQPFGLKNIATSAEDFNRATEIFRATISELCRT
jgi:hypothetical protein